MGVLPILEKNLLSLNNINNYKIIKKDINNKDFFLKLELKFDLIFLDPPYKDKNLTNILVNIHANKNLNKRGIIIIHRHKNEQEILSKSFNLIEERVYGNSKIIFGNYFLDK